MATTTTPQPKDAWDTNGTNGVHEAPHLMTWDEYLSEPTVYRRYDIVEGVRYFMSSPDIFHQVISNVNDVLKAYQRNTQSGRALFAPIDMMIRRAPRIQSRQPDNLSVSNLCTQTVPNFLENGYIIVAPNLVVEILSDSDRRSVVTAKLADYFSIGVDEVWIVAPDERTVSVLMRGLAEYETASTYGETDTLTSATLPGLSTLVADIFAT